MDFIQLDFCVMIAILWWNFSKSDTIKDGQQLQKFVNTKFKYSTGANFIVYLLFCIFVSNHYLTPESV